MACTPSPPEAIELVGMVAPEHRRRGIGTSLLQAALRRCRERGCEKPLLVVPRSSPGGKPLALHHAGTLDQSEHALVLEDPPRPASRRSDATLRRATPDDEPEVSRWLLEAAFGCPTPELRERLTAEQEPTLLIVLGGASVGTVQLSP